MKAIDRQFSKIVNGTTQFVIPVFQRDYRWTEAQCGQLWADIERIGKTKDDRGHFMGSLVYVAAGDTTAGFTRWLLIDGQQRLTTLMLLLLALKQHIVKTGWTAQGDDSPTAKRIEAYFLKNVQEDGDRQYKLMLRRKDQAVLRALLEGDQPPTEGGTRVQENHEYFCERMQHADPEVIYAGIGRLIVVDVILDRTSDDPQMIFESLNSTGVDLSQSDLIRNYILMSLSEAEQSRLYDKYWRPIEELFRDADRFFDSFARDYMALRLGATKQARSEDIYREFRLFMRQQQDDVGLESALAEMQRFAKYYSAFVLGRGAPAALAPSFHRLNRLAEVAAILVMRLFDCHERRQTLGSADFAEAITMLESYVFRRSVCGMQTRGYWQVFSSLAQRISEDQPLRSLLAQLHRLKGSYRFPMDGEFLDEIGRRDCYNMRTAHYLLDRLENHDNKEPTDTRSYTIEHILPQNPNLRSEWKEMLGNEWKSIHQTWVHRLGNLTLTGYNSTYSDRPLNEKQTIEGGLKQSSVRLNRDVRDVAKWTATEIEQRGQRLATQAVKIWPRGELAPEQLRLAEQEELRRQAANLSIGSVGVVDDVRPLFDAIRARIVALHESVIEVPRAKTVSYHSADGDFFAELLPRRRRVLVLLNLELGESEYRDEHVRDATDYRWLANASNAGGVFYDLTAASQIEAAMNVVRQAYELAAQ